MVRNEVGYGLVPCQGFRRDPTTGEVSLRTGQLIVNSTLDVAETALYYYVGDVLSGLAQGKRGTALKKMGRVGAAYGAAAGLLTNLALGAPVRIEKERIEAGRQLVLRNGGNDLKGIAEHATWRMGGLAQLMASNWGITLPGTRPNIWMGTGVAADATTVPHESSHLMDALDQGTESFYCRDGRDWWKVKNSGDNWWKTPGYGRSISTEGEAYHSTDPQPNDPVYNGDPMYIGDVMANSINMGVQALMSWLMARKPRVP